MIDAVSTAGWVGFRRGWRRQQWGLLAVVLVVAGLSLGLGGWVGYRWAKGQQYQVQVLRKAVEAAAAPGEVVVVDDRLLGWALGRGRNGLKTDVLVMRDAVAPSSLLADLDRDRREIVVVARPGSRLVRTLSAAGYTVWKASDTVPWDVQRRGERVLNWGQMRIFFVIAPKNGTDGGKARGERYHRRCSTR